MKALLGVIDRIRQVDSKAPPDRMIELLEELDDAYVKEKRRLGRKLIDRLRQGDQEQLIARALSAFNASDTTHHFMKYARRYDGMVHASSFRALMALRTRRMMLLGRASCPEWVVSGKDDAYRFADILKLQRPRREKEKALGKLRFRPGTVIKPTLGAGGEGVFLIYAEHDIWDVRNNRRLSGYDTLRDHLQDYQTEFSHRRPVWSVEELIEDPSRQGNAALDWKCYCFYGNVEMVGAIQRSPVHAEIWLDADGREVDRGAKRADRLAPLPALPKGLIDLASTVSLALPAPFIRIDFIAGANGLVLNEFTARPGTTQQYHKSIDAALGDAFIRAEHRLQDDLLSGKTFPAFEAFKAERPFRAFKRLMMGRG